MQLTMWFLEMVAEKVSMLNLLNISCSAHYWLQGVPELLAVQWWSSTLWPMFSLKPLFFFQILTWKFWIAQTWGLVAIEIWQRNKKCYVKGQGIFLKKYLSSHFTPKKKKKEAETRL